jgi:hypothetical protein
MRDDALYIEKARFSIKKMFLENGSKHCLHPELKPEPKLLKKVGTGTATNHYGSRTLADPVHIILGS